MKTRMIDRQTIAVRGFGRNEDGSCQINIEVKDIGVFQFIRRNGIWTDHNGFVVNKLNNEMLEIAWKRANLRIVRPNDDIQTQ